MHSPRRRQNAKRSRFAHCNTLEALRRRRAKNDARREALARTLPPVATGPEPLSLWQTVTLHLYVPTHGRCDQHAVVMDGQRVGLLSATQIGVLVRRVIRNRPSVAVLADVRRMAA
jgi:hypothetical protein